MIKADKGMVHVSGTGAEILTDLTTITRSLLEHWTEQFGSEFAAETLALAGRLAVLSQNDDWEESQEAEELRDEYLKALERCM